MLYTIFLIVGVPFLIIAFIFLHIYLNVKKQYSEKHNPYKPVINKSCPKCKSMLEAQFIEGSVDQLDPSDDYKIRCTKCDYKDYIIDDWL